MAFLIDSVLDFKLRFVVFMHLFIKSKTTNRILKNTTFLAIGSIVSKGIGFFIFIYIARILGPASYGNYWTIIGFISLFAIITTFGLDMAVLREGAKNLDNIDEYQNKLFPIRLYLSFSAIVLTCGIVFFLPYSFELKALIIIASPILIIGGTIQAGLSEHFNTTYRIVERMHHIALFQIIRMIIFVGIVLVFISYEKLNVLSVIIALLLSSFITLILRFLHSKKYVHYKFNLKIDWEFCKPLLYVSFWFGLATLLATIISKIDIQMLYWLSSSKEVGYYSAAWQVVICGEMFISGLSLSLFPTSSRSILKPGYSRKLFILVSIITTLSCIIAAITVFTSESIIVSLFGERFLSSAALLSILIWFIPIRLLMIWGSQSLECMNALKIRLVGFVVPLILNISLNFYLIPKYDAIGAAIASIIAYLFMLIILTYLGRKVLHAKMKGGLNVIE
ncbi:MAG: flippase [Candidatus Scalindua sediminis]|nr:flippase [Candidatus Scalindua sediminis]